MCLIECDYLCVPNVCVYLYESICGSIFVRLILCIKIYVSIYVGIIVFLILYVQLCVIVSV